jgi:uncharacterized protein (TIGR02246 family)
MRALHSLLLLTTFTALGCAHEEHSPAPAPTAPAAPNPEQARAAIQQSNARFEQAFAQGDAATVASLYTPDAVVLAPHSKPLEGAAAIQSLWEGAMKAGAKSVRLQTVDVQTGGELAVETGRYTMVSQPAAGAQLTDEGNYLVVWKRGQDGSWRMSRDTFSSSQPAAPAAGGSGADATAQRARNGQQVWVVPNKVKADKRAQYERFVEQSLWAAVRQQAQRDPKAAEVLRTTRRLVPSGPDEDGRYTYAFVMDPVIEGYDYEILSILTQVYGDQGAQQRYREYKDALAEEPEDLSFTQRAP